MDSKTDLRIKAKELRKTLDISLISTNIAEQIRESFFYKNAHNILLFYPTKYEIDLTVLLDDDKNFYLPKVSGKNLYICPFKKGDKLEKSSFNILEPCSNPIDAKILNLIFTPALMVDKKGYRLGYGGGFYDRFLKNYPDITTVCPIAEELYVKELPSEEFDVKIDYVISGKC